MKKLHQLVENNLEKVLFKIDTLYDKDQNSYYKIYRQFYNICKKYNIVEGELNEQKRYKLTEIKKLESDFLLDLHSDLTKLIQENKQLKIEIKLES